MSKEEAASSSISFSYGEAFRRWANYIHSDEEYKHITDAALKDYYRKLVKRNPLTFGFFEVGDPPHIETKNFNRNTKGSIHIHTIENRIANC